MKNLLLFLLLAVSFVRSNAQSKDMVLTASGETIPLQQFLERFKGTTVYTDVWASWCGPCRSQFPYSRKLEKKYEGKAVSFLYISIDRDISSWKKASQIEGIDQSKSALILNFDDSDLYKTFRIDYIPRYLMYNADGTILKTNAPRPGDKKLEKFLKKKLG